MVSGTRLWFVNKYATLLHIVQYYFVGLGRNTIV
jgi:hypothetical protein